MAFNLNDNHEEIDVVDTPDANEHLPAPEDMDSGAQSGNEFQTELSEDSNAEEWGEFVTELMEPEQLELEAEAALDIESKATPSDEPKEEPAVIDDAAASPDVAPEVDPVAATDEDAKPPAVEEPSESLIPQQPEVESPEPVAITKEEVSAARGQYIASLAKQYQMSEADAIRFEENPAAVLPEMAANLHAQVMENVMAQMQQQMPQMINQQTSASTVSQNNENEFMEAWPELKDHGTAVAQVAQDWRASNPTASKEQAIQAVGFNTLIKLGVDPMKAAQRMTNGFEETPVAAKPTPMRPHTPAGAGKTSARQEAVAPSPGLWEEMVTHNEEWQQ